MEGYLQNINDLKYEIKETYFPGSSPTKFFVLIRCIPLTCAGLQVMASNVFRNT